MQALLLAVIGTPASSSCFTELDKSANIDMMQFLYTSCRIKMGLSGEAEYTHCEGLGSYGARNVAWGRGERLG